MKKIYYIYVCLGVLLLTALPAKAASEAEFGKLAKTYTLHKDVLQLGEVQSFNSIHLLQFNSSRRF